ncbi:ribosomal biogenesis protein LAS1L-like [Pelmatolapia mariae]|uniref:ribosomal biogenesis protein LAS1L-like n=1 Tax=Pelmatolapia mariae TaxID=158779 RepID=UPI002FE66994
MALQRISAWRDRYADSASVAIDCTADLVRCQLRDWSGPLNDDELVLMYGMALVRFVSLITERKNRRKPRTMKMMARKLNIPEWLVNLRYKGCEAALEWLKEEYCARQFREDEETDLKQQEDDVLQKVEQFALESRDLLIDVLLEDGFLVPTIEQLEALGCDTSDSASPTEPRVPQTFLHLWLPLLKMVSSPSFIHLFLEKLFVKQKLLTKEPNGHRAFYISAWISEVLLCNGNKWARMKDRIFTDRIQLRWLHLIALCLDAPCISMPHLLQLILDDMEH